MIALLNVGRFLMVLWVLYNVVLIFAPQLVHQPKNPVSGLAQCVCAYTVGYLLDRWLSRIKRRRAAAPELPATENPTI